MAMTYRTLGRSGLVVSPLALGTMTFGAGRWGADEAVSRAILERYLGLGGNFVDTADIYAGGASEQMLGRFMAEAGNRERIVLATKAGFNRGAGPNSGGNGAKNIKASLERSLKALQTDYVDMFWVHTWDSVTPAEELLGTLQGLVQAGMVRYFGLSNVPGWYAAQLATLAGNGPRPIALQMEYSLTERGMEKEHIPLAQAMGMALQPWSPLSGGFLTGKYRREEYRVGQAAAALPDAPAEGGGEGRLNGANPFGESKFTERNWGILEVLRGVAEEVGFSVAQVGLAWVLGQPGVVAPLLGASKPAQIDDLMAATGIVLGAEHLARLEAVSAVEWGNPYMIFQPMIRRMIFGGAEVRGWV